MASNPTGGGRNRRQKLKAAYQKAREEAQLHDLIPTTPEGAIRDERVDPASQDEQKFPGLDRMAIRNDGRGWEVNEHIRRRVIEVNAEILFEKPRTVQLKDGKEIEVPPDRALQQQASRVLIAADERQYERDHPKDKSGGVVINNNVVIDPFDLYRRELEKVRDESEDQPREDNGARPTLLAGPEDVSQGNGDGRVGGDEHRDGGERGQQDG